ncbi:MAG: DUF1553 domain-containing protein [Planctomycetes bacterium]|nr:DUF1553 domain-containing protein [Planctomycetota bacterium]
MSAVLLIPTAAFAADEPKRANPTARASQRFDVATLEIKRLSAFPPRIHLRGRDSEQQLVVTVTVPDRLLKGRRQLDVTDRVRFASGDQKIARVSADGRVTPVGSGRTNIHIRVGAAAITVPVTVVDGDRFLPINFSNDIVPIFTRLGCNSGSCHGKSDGRGGFRLSLFGFTPRLDYNSITRGARGRRVFPAAPDRSLLLRKPLSQIPHGGGRRLTAAQPETARLRRWIADDMPWGKADAPGIERIELFPSARVMRPGQRQRIVATAVYSDGSTRDVTRLVQWRSQDAALADVETGSAVVTANQRFGETAIVAQYQEQIAVFTVTVPVTASKVPPPQFPVRNFVDRQVLTKLERLRMPNSPLANDSVLLRRATIHLAGRLPTLKETRGYLADSDSGKFDKLIDRLLKNDDFADVFAQKWSGLLRNRRRGQEKRIPGTKAFHAWIRRSFRENRPFDRFVRDILTATESVKTNPPAQWYAEVRYLDRYVDDTAQVFLGIRIGCARCHHHPFEKFSQDDYFGLAAFFGRVGRTGGTGGSERASNETIYVKSAGEVKHPLTGNVVLPQGLGGRPLEIPPCEDPRGRLVDWMVHPRNPYFAKAFANRMWAHFFGRGLVEPRDDMRATNPPSNAKLLDALASEFVKSRFDVKHLVRVICRSSVYRFSSNANRFNLDETVMHSRFYPRRLSAEVLLDGIDAVTGVPTKYKGLPQGTRALQLPDEGYSNELLKIYGRPNRASACECERESMPTLRQSVFLWSSPFIRNKLVADSGFANRLVKDGRSLDAKIDAMFLTTLSRFPTTQERKTVKKHVQDTPNLREAFEDILWALIHTKEFLFVR